MLRSDEELVTSALTGEVSAFVVLTERHRAGMRATAIAVLGYTDEAEDAVQDAVLTALQRLSDLREPAAAGAWLRQIVRNNCLMRLRQRQPVPVAEPESLLPPADDPRPDEVIERSHARDWVRHAVGLLSPALREVTLLRYFTEFRSYRQIAQLCGIPEETVGSRLRDGRRALTRTLQESSGDAHPEADLEADGHRRLARQHLAAMQGDEYERVIEDWYQPDLSVVALGGLAGDRSALRLMMDYTFSAGVGIRLRDATASGNVLVWETDFLNPASDPDHCPAGSAWLFRMSRGRVARLAVAYDTGVRSGS
ncbi:RNA polymerase sigma factor [Actinoplanes friuliensis]|uniref:RNA polymerase sigma factor n=1 Tax=Actinoplanes friuliensis TaxID=196914 RepID=UPI0005A196DB|nr:RNA polymerase sigma factor [Actinoplanes friuliensis]